MALFTYSKWKKKIKINLQRQNLKNARQSHLSDTQHLNSCQLNPGALQQYSGLGANCALLQSHNAVPGTNCALLQSHNAVPGANCALLQFNQMRQEYRSIVGKIGELEMEVNEHG